MDAISVIVFLIGLMSVLGNGMLLVILFLDPLKKFRTSTSFCIICLAFSDLITGIAGCCYPFPKSASRRVVLGIIWATIVSSFGIIFIMSCERLIVVLYPLKAKVLITRRRVIVLILFNFLCSMMVGFLIHHYFGQMAFYRVVFTCYTIILFLVLVLLGIYIIILCQTTLHQPTILRNSRQSTINGRLEKRLISVLIILVVTLLLTVVPHVLAALVFASGKIFNLDYIPFGEIQIFSKYYFPIELLNFAVNPLIYGWRLPTYRNSLVFYLKRWSNCRRKDDKELSELQEISAEDQQTRTQLHNV